MVQISPINFGLIIAYFLPGFIAVFSLKYVSAEMATLLQAAQATPLNVGAMVFVVTASLVAGLVISAVRTIVIDYLHYKTHVEKPVIDYSRLVGDKRKLFQEMVENIYRYYQFYGNIMCSLIILLILKYWIAGSPIWDSRQHVATFALLIGAIVSLFLSSRKQLSDVCKSITDICK